MMKPFNKSALASLVLATLTATASQAETTMSERDFNDKLKAVSDETLLWSEMGAMENARKTALSDRYEADAMEKLIEEDKAKALEVATKPLYERMGDESDAAAPINSQEQVDILAGNANQGVSSLSESPIERRVSSLQEEQDKFFRKVKEYLAKNFKSGGGQSSAIKTPTAKIVKVSDIDATQVTQAQAAALKSVFGESANVSQSESGEITFAIDADVVTSDDTVIKNLTKDQKVLLESATNDAFKFKFDANSGTHTAILENSGSYVTNKITMDDAKLIKDIVGHRSVGIAEEADGTITLDLEVDGSTRIANLTQEQAAAIESIAPMGSSFENFSDGTTVASIAQANAVGYKIERNVSSKSELELLAETLPEGASIRDNGDGTFTVIHDADISKTKVMKNEKGEEVIVYQDEDAGDIKFTAGVAFNEAESQAAEESTPSITQPEKTPSVAGEVLENAEGEKFWVGKDSKGYTYYQDENGNILAIKDPNGMFINEDGDYLEDPSRFFTIPDTNYLIEGSSFERSWGDDDSVLRYGAKIKEFTPKRAIVILQIHDVIYDESDYRLIKVVKGEDSTYFMDGTATLKEVKILEYGDGHITLEIEGSEVIAMP